MKSLTLLLALAALSGCTLFNLDDGECDAERFERDLRTLRADIDAEVGEAEASSVEACRVLPIGDKACGGPAAYLVYSAEASDVERLGTLAAEHRRTDRARNDSCGLASTCEITPEPEVILEEGRCVAR